MAVNSKTALRLAQAYSAARDRRLAMEQQAEKLKESEMQLRQQFMDMMAALNIKTVGDGYTNYELVTTNEPAVIEWEPLYKHVMDTGEFDLLYRRVNSAAVKARWDQDKAVPGVGAYPVTKLSVTKGKGNANGKAQLTSKDQDRRQASKPARRVAKGTKRSR